MSQKFTGTQIQPRGNGMLFHSPYTGYKSLRGEYTATAGITYWGAFYLITSSSVLRTSSIEYMFDLAAGTYTLAHLGTTNTDHPILTYYLDGTSIGTIEWNAAAVANVLKTITGISVTTPGLKSLTLVANDTTSSGYSFVILGLAFWRTA